MTQKFNYYFQYFLKNSKGPTGDKGLLGDNGPTGDTGKNIFIKNLIIIFNIFCKF